MPLLLDGKKVRDEIAAKLREKIAAFSSKPKLVILQVGGNKESAAYIRQKKSFGENIGAVVEHMRFAAEVPLPELLSVIQQFNNDCTVHGIILQLPIPPHLNRQKLLDAVALEKDVDGLAQGSTFIPATARGVFELLSHYGISVADKKVSVFGRSFIAGGPIAQLLSARGARVTVLNSKTPTEEAQAISRKSDIIVVAIGKPKFIGLEYFRNDKTQIVVDVGINRVATGEALAEEVPPLDKTRGRQLVGDVDFESVAPLAAAISPVPGGVGPMTVASLFQNLVEAYEWQVQLDTNKQRSIHICSLH